MNIYKYTGSASISTDKEKTLVIGELYDYKEGSLIGECQFIADESSNEYWIWRFKWTIAPTRCEYLDGQEFTCSELKNSEVYYSGMWRLYNKGDYMFSRRQHIREEFKNL